MNKLASILFLFFGIHYGIKFYQFGDLIFVLKTLMAFLVSLYFLKQVREENIDLRPVTVLICVMHFLIPLAFFKTHIASVNLGYGTAGILIGLIISGLAVIDLNTSIGLLPALREVRTGGVYRFIRHPMYAGYLITLTFFTSISISLWNLSLLLMFYIVTIVRIRNEEKVLIRSSEYKRYTSKVRYKFIPGVI
tara:strand:+ start:91645 stop:92223 length:579 start_codon:yes stop_codon:yes gene_type:complete